MASRQVVLRIGDPYPFGEKGIQQHSNKAIVNSESAYFLAKDELAFSGVLIDYSDFLENPEDPDVFYEYVHCFAWKMVQDIDSPIYIRDVADGSIDGAGFHDEKWSDIGEAELDSLHALVSMYSEEMPDEMEGFSKHYVAARREALLNKIIGKR